MLRQWRDLAFRSVSHERILEFLFKGLKKEWERVELPRWKSRCCAHTRLLLRNPRRLTHLVPARELGEHELAELLRRRALHGNPGFGELLAHRLVLQRL